MYARDARVQAGRPVEEILTDGEPVGVLGRPLRASTTSTPRWSARAVRG
ncbi:hypothetical protein [Streptosporangium vulgare]